MGAFNTLAVNTVCPVCERTADFEIQFKFGNTWQYHYEIGQRVRWGGNDIGTAGHKRVLVEGIGGPCLYCGTDDIGFDLVIEEDLIVGVNGIGKERKNNNPQGFIIVTE